MNKFLKTDISTSKVDIALLITRIGVAILMLTHGIPKLQMLFEAGEIQFPGVLGLSPKVSLGLTVFSEVLCSILIFLGLWTRLATIPVIITMLVAVFMIHLNDPFVKMELGLLYLLHYLPLLILGSGKYSLDWVLNAVRRPLLNER